MKQNKNKAIRKLIPEELQKLYSEVDQRAKPLKILHAERLQCHRGCFSCCVDDITVFEVEALNIRFHFGELLETGAAYPPGLCAFLDEEGTCRIYSQRPYVCRTQGLPLRWFEELPDGSIAEMRDICPLNDVGEAVESLPAASCWSIGPTEGKLAVLQSQIDGGELRRVSLRSLFKRE